MNIPTDPHELADIIYENSTDWQSTLAFLEEYAHSVGVEINKRVISNIIIERIEG